jgi:transposase
MNTYKVRIHVEEIDKDKKHYRDLGAPYEAGRFNTEKAARRFVENELLIIREVNTMLRNTCRAVLKLLSSLSKGGLKTLMQKLALCRKMLHEAVNCKIPAVDDSCPKCGAGCDQREFVKRDFLDIDAVHVHYTCKKCGSDIIEEFTLSEVFIDSPRT